MEEVVWMLMTTLVMLFLMLSFCLYQMMVMNMKNNKLLSENYTLNKQLEALKNLMVQNKAD